MGEYNLDGYLLLIMATVQVGFVLLSNLLKMSLSSISELKANHKDTKPVMLKPRLVKKYRATPSADEEAIQ